MRVCNLASGSKGNCTYFETESAKILIDAGLSATELGKRLSMLGVTLGEIDAVIVTHEHIDHIKALSTLANKYGIKIYAHVDEWQAINCKQKINPTRQMAFFDDAFNIFDATITPIRLSHDSHTCFGYTVENFGKKFSILTDLGQTNDRILSAVSGSVLVYLEANHDEDMLSHHFEPGFQFHVSALDTVKSCERHFFPCALFCIVEFSAVEGERRDLLSHGSGEHAALPQGRDVPVEGSPHGSGKSAVCHKQSFGGVAADNHFGPSGNALFSAVGIKVRVDHSVAFFHLSCDFFKTGTVGGKTVGVIVVDDRCQIFQVIKLQSDQLEPAFDFRCVGISFCGFEQIFKGVQKFRGIDETDPGSGIPGQKTLPAADDIQSGECIHSFVKHGVETGHGKSTFAESVLVEVFKDLPVIQTRSIPQFAVHVVDGPFQSE